MSSKQYIKENNNRGRTLGYISEDNSGNKSYYKYSSNRVEYREDRYGTLRDKNGKRVNSVRWDD